MITTFINKKLIYQKILSKIKENNPAFIISGGNTIKEIFKYLDQKINNYILLSDERLVKKESKLRNDYFFYKLIEKNYISKKKFFAYDSSVIDYKKLNNFNSQIEKINFNLAILSLGSNGHFASIFDKKKILNSYYFIDNSPKFPKSRVTVSLEKLKKCKQIIFVASKKNKKNEIKNFYKNSLIEYLGYNKTNLYIY